MGQSTSTIDPTTGGSLTGGGNPFSGKAGDAAATFGLIGVGLQSYGAYETGAGNKAADVYKAEQLDRAAQYGELKATQTNAQMTRNQAITLGQLDAIRAAGHTDPTSPTGAAVRDFTEQVGTEQKNIRVDSILAQSQEDEANAAYLRQAGSQALLSGEITAGADVVTGIAKGLSGLPGG
jgi:hypothetical protein